MSIYISRLTPAILLSYMTIVLLTKHAGSSDENIDPLCSSENGSTTVRLGNMATLLSTGYWEASHFEDDLADSSNETIIISSYGCIRTFNLKTKKLVTIFGSTATGYDPHGGTDARFDDITGFRQINETALLAVDSRNHCIRLLDRSTNRTNYQIGRCQKSGNTTGPLTRFYYPHSVTDGQYRHEFLVTDSYNDALRLYKLVDESVEPLIVDSSKLRRPRDMVFDAGRNFLFVTVHLGVTKIDMRSPTFVRQFFGESLFTMLTYGITRLPFTDIYLVTHRGNGNRHSGNKLTQFNGTSMSVIGGTICTGDFGGRNGDRDACHIYNPWSIRYSTHLQGLIIGSHQYIRQFHVKFYNVAANQSCTVGKLVENLPPRHQTSTTVSTSRLTTTTQGTDNVTLTRNKTSASDDAKNGTELAGVLPDIPLSGKLPSTLQGSELTLILVLVATSSIFFLVILVLATKLASKQRSMSRRVRDNGNILRRSTLSSATTSEYTNVYESVRSSALDTITVSSLGRTPPVPRRVQRLRFSARGSQSINSEYELMGRNGGYENENDIEQLLAAHHNRERAQANLAMENDTYSMPVITISHPT